MQVFWTVLVAVCAGDVARMSPNSLIDVLRLLYYMLAEYAYHHAVGGEGGGVGGVTVDRGSRLAAVCCAAISLTQVAAYIAVVLDPEKNVLFVQSRCSGHLAQLGWGAGAATPVFA